MPSPTTWFTDDDAAALIDTDTETDIVRDDALDPAARGPWQRGRRLVWTSIDDGVELTHQRWYVGNADQTRGWVELSGGSAELADPDQPLLARALEKGVDRDRLCGNFSAPSGI